MSLLYVSVPKAEISRENMFVWKNFANQVVLQQMALRQVSREQIVSELTALANSTQPNGFKIMEKYLDPNDTTFFTVTRFNLILPTLLKWSAKNNPSVLRKVFRDAKQFLTVK